MAPSRSFVIRTYGCQMNVHDSQKIENLLHHAGYTAAPSEDDADLLLINTCSIRDKAENQLYSDLGRLGVWKAERPGRSVGVGGCVAQQVGDRVMKRFPQVDFVFGTHNVRLVPAMAHAAEQGDRSVRVDENRSQARFDLPERHPAYEGPQAGRAFVTVMEGCDMYCSFCIVPLTRGREISRPASAILREVEVLAERGVREVTLLGQTVNAYGRHDLRRGESESAGTVAFAELLRRIDAIPGIERIRYTSPHPLFFDDALIRAHGELESLCPHVHLPLQSGSNEVLERMRRRYTREQFLDIVLRLREARPDIALTSDVIVAFPGESESQFAETLEVVDEAGFVDSFSFKFSPRPGTGAEQLGQEGLGGEEAQRRLARLQELQRGLTLTHHRSRVGAVVEILVEGESRRGGGQLSGRDPHHRLVNVNLAADAQRGASPAPQPGSVLAPRPGSKLAPQPGSKLKVVLVEATPHSLIGELAAPEISLSSPPSPLKGSSRLADERSRNVVLEGQAGDLPLVS
ncbi:MAG: tRNA (N6-isopentenyl adenosine(37)-C2)-methylthiotransferase MiaB [Deltaproteobacteria bacterium]|nr:tRNA (N6-isopentenyl adenosine(37)-C2)-methylthiotransferase MiaB [Deltaproteobacteria bacterium]